MMHLFDYPLLLASQSPRRRQLLEQAGFRFEVA
ncbi:MAG: Maf family protein, partial [Phaeodactylibacter sp.]|nr:Maf family protein [Phaeodactylibacter sp.]